jgi:hypothetical protein
VFGVQRYILLCWERLNSGAEGIKLGTALDLLNMIPCARVVFAAFAALAIASCSGSVLTSRQLCLDSTGSGVSCIFSREAELPALSRAVCASNDYNCLCLQAITYNTAIRQRHGMKPVPAGTVAMLANAVRNSQGFTDGRFEHQKLSSVTDEIQCNTFCSGENIAKFSGPSEDPAKKCMDMWENSEGHLENILRDNGMTVVGIYQKDGWTYCTQTFGLDGQGVGTKSGAQCKAVGSSGAASGAAQASAPQPTSSEEPFPSTFPSAPSEQNRPAPSLPPSSPAAPSETAPPLYSSASDTDSHWWMQYPWSQYWHYGGESYGSTQH